MNAMFSARDEVRAPIASSAANYVCREYGETGYRIGLCWTTGRVGVFEVSAGDGSRFNIIADAWGNAETIAEDATEASANMQIVAMDKRACTV